MEKIKSFFSRYKQFPLLYTLNIIASAFTPMFVAGVFLGHACFSDSETRTRYQSYRRDLFSAFLFCLLVRVIAWLTNVIISLF